MSFLTNKSVSDKTLMLWIVYSFASVLVCLLIAAIVILLTYDCWPIARYQFGSNVCIDKVSPSWLKFIPIAVGVVIGTVLTYRLKNN